MERCGIKGHEPLHVSDVGFGSEVPKPRGRNKDGNFKTTTLGSQHVKIDVIPPDKTKGYPIMETMLAPWAPRFLSILRIVAGLIFLAHGTQKLLGFPATERVTEAFSLSWYAAVIELVCGVLLVIGFLTRPAAFLASGTMAFAYWIAHAPRDFFPVNNGGDAAILYCFLFLYLVFAGPGPWSVDAARKRTA